MLDIVQRALDTARRLGAGETAVRGSVVREVGIDWRDGKLETIQEATRRGLALDLYVDGRYGTAETSDLRPEAIDAFIGRAIAMTRTLAPDPHRHLPDPALYRGQATADLLLEDQGYAAHTADRRRDLARAVEEAARSAHGADRLVSVTSSASDTLEELYHVTSNGFDGRRRATTFWLGAEASAKDPAGGRPQESDFRGARRLAELPDAQELGRSAAARTLGRVGARKMPSGPVRLAVDNRVAGRLLVHLVRPLLAVQLQQKQSFLDGKIGEEIGSARFEVADDPLVPRGLGSRLFDGEGLAARRLPLFERGVLRNFFVDTYYGRKLGMPPTTARTSNLVVAPGERSQAELLADLGDGVLVTGFLGGNSNPTTGDFSLGVFGFQVKGGKLGAPIAEMNLAGNQRELWRALVAVGNDPWTFSSMRSPTLVFERAMLAGS